MKKFKIKVCKVRPLAPQVYPEQKENFLFENRFSGIMIFKILDIHR